MEKTGWRVVAIIFVILFIVETLGIICVIKLGISEMNKEAECANNICYNNGYTSYIIEDNICGCYLNGELKYKENMP